jgi:hypothetical protein
MVPRAEVEFLSATTVNQFWVPKIGYYPIAHKTTYPDPNATSDSAEQGLRREEVVRSGTEGA